MKYSQVQETWKAVAHTGFPRTAEDRRQDLVFINHVEQACANRDGPHVILNREELRRLRALAGHKQVAGKKFDKYRKRKSTILGFCAIVRLKIESEMTNEVVRALW